MCKEEIKEVAISYAWTSPEHIVKVEEFAKRLTEDRIYVHFDRWDFKKGQSLSKNMEDLLISNDISNILIICDKVYAEKADARDGGVGTETLIISPEVYKNAKQDKVIPIIWERSEDGKPYLPKYLTDRDYIDLSDDEIFEEQYKELVMQIYGKPKHKRPELGKIPNYVLEDSPSFKTSSFSLKLFSSKLKNNPLDINNISKDFLETYLTDLETIHLNKPTKDYNDTSALLIAYIEKYDLIRDIFIQFMDKITKTSDVELTIDTLIDFFVEIEFQSNIFNRENELADRLFYQFILIELFLYTITFGLKNEKYEFVSKLIYSPYFFKNNEIEPDFFVKFDNNPDLNKVLNYFIYYNQKNKLLSPIGEMIIGRLYPNIKNDMIVDADLICFYVSLIYNADFEEVWTPYTYPYKQNKTVDLIRKLSKKSHFEKVKCIFKVDTTQDLQKIFNDLNLEIYHRYGFNRIRSYPLPISKSINSKDIGKYPY